MNLTPFKNYYDRYMFHLRSSDTCREAWEKTEEDYKEAHNSDRYNSYETFKSALSRYRKKK